MVGQGHAQSDSQGQHAAEALRVHVVVLQPPDLGLLSQSGVCSASVPALSCHGPVQGRLGVSGVGLGAVLVDLVLGVVVRDDDGGVQELGFSQARVVGSLCSRAERVRGRAGTYRTCASCPKTCLRATRPRPLGQRLGSADLLGGEGVEILWGGGSRGLRSLEGRVVPPVVFASLSLHQLGDALDLAFPEESLAVVERVRGRSS